jgi:hypothetical protein
MPSLTRPIRTTSIFAVFVCVVMPGAAAAVDITLEKTYLAGLAEKLPPCPFEKTGQYRGTVDMFRILAIDPRTRQFRVACRIAGEFHQRSVLKKLKDNAGGTGSQSVADDGRWKAFSFDVRAAVNLEPGPDGMPRFRVDVEEVKRQELEGAAGILAKVMGRHFDEIVTRVADGKADRLSNRLNSEINRKAIAFREYGVFCGIDYTPDQVALHFDLTRLRREGIAGYVYATPHPGAVPLYRWRRIRTGSHFYTTSPNEPDPRAYASEGIACYVLPQATAGAAPFYRWIGRKEHFFTTAADGEGGARTGLLSEGVACYVFPTPKPDTVPFYRFVDPRNGLHFFTTHPHAEFAK